MSKITSYNTGKEVELSHKALVELLEKTATENEDCSFIHTSKGRLVIFNPERFIWNAYGKDSLDRESQLSSDQWHDFVSSEDYLYLEIADSHHQAFDDYCEEIREDETEC